MDSTLITETALIGGLIVVGIKPVTESAIAAAKAVGTTRAAKAAKDAQAAPAPLEETTGHALRPAAPKNTAGAADTAPASAGNPEPPRIRGQFARADGGNRITDEIRAMVLAEQNGSGS